MNLSEKILIFVENCLPEIKHKFSHSAMQEAFDLVFRDKYSIATLRKEFSNLKTAGLIKNEKRYSKSIPALTRTGQIKISAHLPYKKFGHWDNKWRIVLFNLPEKERNFRLELQKKLAELGFQKIQNGAYISPHPFLATVNRISTELGIRQYLTLIEGDKIERQVPAVEQIWNLTEINQNYHNFIIEAQKSLRQKEKLVFWPLRAKVLEQEFYQNYQRDPHLPENLLPGKWQGIKAYQVYKELVNSY